jgi:copper transport protein
MGLALSPSYWTSTAWGHASLVRSEPADGAMVAQPPAALTLTFNEPVSPLVIRLIGPDGATVSPAVKAEDTILTITPPPLQQGTHALSWRVISADGHPVGGSLVFSVGTASERPELSAPGHASVRGALWAAKLVLYVGVFVGIGGAFFRAWIAADAARRADAVAAIAMAAGLVAAPVSVGLQGLDALDLPLSGLAQADAWQAGVSTAYGPTALTAALALLAGLGALVASRGLGRILALAAVLGVGLALSLSGHAGTVEPRWLTRGSVFLHGGCVAVWVGALWPLLAAIRDADHGTVAFARFTRLIPYPLVVLIVTGTVLAVVQLDRLDALWTTNYGLVLAGKLAAVAALLALGALNRYRLVPAFAASDPAAGRALARSIACELVLALTILGLVALWRFTPPPRALAQAGQVSVHLHGARAMAQVEIALRRARGAAVDILVLDAELRPLAVKEVTLVLSHPAAAIEPLRRNATSEGEGNWRVDDLSVPLAGRWRLRVEILIDDFEKVALEDQVELPRMP